MKGVQLFMVLMLRLLVKRMAYLIYDLELNKKTEFISKGYYCSNLVCMTLIATIEALDSLKEPTSVLLYTNASNLLVFVKLNNIKMNVGEQ